MAVFNVQKLFCFAGVLGGLFVTALRTICLTVGVIVGKMERVSGAIYSDVRVGVRAEQQCGNSGRSACYLGLLDDHQISQLADFVFSGWRV